MRAVNILFISCLLLTLFSCENDNNPGLMSNQEVTINGISSPEQGIAIDSPFVLDGAATPGSTINIEMVYKDNTGNWQEMIFLPTNIACENGFFSHEIQYIEPVPSTEIKITMTATKKELSPSNPYEIQVVQTEDHYPPTIKSITPTNNSNMISPLSTVKVVFSEQMNPAISSLNVFSALYPSYSYEVKWSNLNKEMEIIPNEPWGYFDTITVDLTNFADTAGNTIPSSSSIEFQIRPAFNTIEVVSLSLNQTSLTSGDELDILLKLFDDGFALDEDRVILYLKQPSQSLIPIIMEKETDHQWKATLSINDYYNSGKYTLYKLCFASTKNNASINYEYNNDLEKWIKTQGDQSEVVDIEGLEFTVSGTTGDTDLPQLLSLDSSLESYSGIGTDIIITGGVLDNSSQVVSLSVEIVQSGLSDYVISLPCSINSTDFDCVYTTQDGDMNGEWYVGSVYMSDQGGNSVHYHTSPTESDYYSSLYHQAFDIPGVYFIVNGLTEDTTRPQIQNIDLSEGNFEKGQSPYLNITATDNLVGIVEMMAYFEGPSAFEITMDLGAISAAEYSGYYKVHGNENQGEYTLTKIEAMDNAGNQVVLGFNEAVSTDYYVRQHDLLITTIPIQSFNITSTLSDINAPLLNSVEYTLAASKQQTISIAIQGWDNVSGIQKVEYNFDRATLQGSAEYFFDTIKDESSNKWRGGLLVTDYLPSGEWRIDAIRLTDYAGNSATYEYKSAISTDYYVNPANFPTTVPLVLFFIIGTDSDTISPTYNSINLNPVPPTTIAKGDRIVMDVQASDLGGSGIYEVFGTMENNGYIREFMAYPYTTNLYRYIFTNTASTLAGEWDILEVSIRDKAGNITTESLAGSYNFTFEGPYITLTIPANGETNVSANSNITIHFSQAMQTSAYNIQIIGSMSGEHSLVENWTGGDTQLELNPDVDFTAEEQIYVQWNGFLSTDGYPLTGITNFSFSIAP